MSGAGFRFVNVDGIVQVDSRFKNLCLHDKLSGVTGAQTITCPHWPVLAVRGASSRVAIKAVVSAGGDDYNIVVVGTGDVFVFAEPDPTYVSGGVGAVIFQEGTGEVAWDSRMPFFKPVGTFVLDAAEIYPPADDTTIPGFTPDGAKSYAAIISNGGERVVSTGVNSGLGYWIARIYSFGIKGGTGFLWFGGVDMAPAQAPSEFYDGITDGTARDGLITIVDVTGL